MANRNNAGTSTMEYRVMDTFFPSRMISDKVTSSSVFTTSMICTERKRRMVSTSLVQR